MTDTQPTTASPGFATRYGLIRPHTDRHIAGVCAGVARATQTDPLLWRVLVAVGVLFGGVGLVAYLLGWLLMPEEGDTGSPLEALFGRGRSATSTLLTVLLAVATVFLLVVTVQWTPLALLAAAGAGYLLYRQLEQRPGGPGPHGTPPPTAAPPPAGPLSGPPPAGPSAGPPQAGPPAGPPPAGPHPDGPAAGPHPGGPPPAGSPPGEPLPPEREAPTPADAVPGKAGPGEAGPGETVPDEEVPGEAMPGEEVPGDTRSDEVAAGEEVPEANGESAATGHPGVSAAATPPWTGVTVPVPLEKAEPADDGAAPPAPVTSDEQARHQEREEEIARNTEDALLAAAQRYQTERLAPEPIWPVAPAPPPQPQPRTRPSRLGRVAMFAMLIAIGLVAAMDLAGGGLGVGAYAAAALAVIGAALVVGTWIGRARWLIWLGALLSVVLAVSAAISTADVRVDGRETWRPTSVAELRPLYEIDLGSGELDLRQVDFTGQDVTITLTVNSGNLEVILPPDVDVEGQASVAYGNAGILGEEFSGSRNTGRTFTDVGEDGAPGPGKITLDAEVNLGNLEVRR